MQFNMKKLFNIVEGTMVVTICVKVTTTVPVRMKEMMLVKRPLIGRKIVLDPLGGPIDDSKTALDGTRSILTFISIIFFKH